MEIIRWRDIDGHRRQVSGRTLAMRKAWWENEIGGALTHGRTYYRYLKGLCPACGDDPCCSCEGSKENRARHIMGICARRHEETNYECLLGRHSKDEARALCRREDEESD